MLCDSLIYILLGTISRYFVIELLCLMFHDKTCGVSQFVKIAFLVNLNVILLLYSIVSGKIDALFFFFQNSLICFWTLTLYTVVKSRSMLLFTLSNLPLFLGNSNSCILQF